VRRRRRRNAARWARTFYPELREGERPRADTSREFTRLVVNNASQAWDHHPSSVLLPQLERTHPTSSTGTTPQLPQLEQALLPQLGTTHSGFSRSVRYRRGVDLWLNPKALHNPQWFFTVGPVPLGCWLRPNPKAPSLGHFISAALAWSSALFIWTTLHYTTHYANLFFWLSGR
jgi:hypothetical protein